MTSRPGRHAADGRALVIALDRAVALKDLVCHPVLADLADLLDGGGGARDPGSDAGSDAFGPSQELPRRDDLPVQEWLDPVTPPQPDRLPAQR